MLMTYYFSVTPGPSHVTISIYVFPPYHFNEDPDPDPCFHLIADPDRTYHFNADQDPAPHQSDVNLRPQVYCTDLRGMETLRLHCERLRSSFAPLWASKVPKIWFSCGSDPDPAFHPCTDPASRNNEDPCGSRSATLYQIHILCMYWGSSSSSLLWDSACSPGIDSEESISPVYAAWQAGMTNRVVVLTGPPGWEIGIDSWAP
jgi:hypothetical protein